MKTDNRRQNYIISGKILNKKRWWTGILVKRAAGKKSWEDWKQYSLMPKNRRNYF